MEDLSLHILDVVENSIRAGAKRIRISIWEDMEADLLELVIEDDGHGMEPEMASRVVDPFVTSRKERRVGLGLSLLAQAAQMADGELEVISHPERGTKVRATFRHSHIDRKPMGDIVGTLTGLIASNPHLDFLYEHRKGGDKYALNTKEVKEVLGEIPINHPEVIAWIRRHMEEGLSELGY